MPRKTKYPIAGRPMEFELPPHLQGDPNQPTVIHWTAPKVQRRRLHEAMRAASFAGDGSEFSAYMDKVVTDLVTAVSNYEDDEGNPVTDAEGLVEHGEPQVIEAFVEYARRGSEATEEEQKKSEPPSESPSTTERGGTDGTTPEEQG